MHHEYGAESVSEEEAHRGVKKETTKVKEDTLQLQLPEVLALVLVLVQLLPEPDWCTRMHV